MRIPLFLLALLCSALAAPLAAQQDATLSGVVSIQNSKHKTGKRDFVHGAAVSATKATPTTTDKNGSFGLIFADVPIGTPTRLTILKDSLEIVNKKEVAEAAVVGRTKPLNVYMCKAGELDARIAEYHEFSVDNYTKSYREKTAALSKQIDRLEKEVKEGKKKEADLAQAKEAYAQLEAQYKKALEDANRLAEQFALVNLDDESDLYATALDTFLRGYVREAIALLESVNLEKRLADNAANVQKGEKIIRETQEKVTQSKQQIEEDTRAAALLAQMYKTQFEFDKAEFYFELALRYDSANVENIYNYAVFLEEFNRYEKALLWLQKTADHPGAEAWRRANAHGLMGEVYKETGKFPQAAEAYLRYSTGFDSLYRKMPDYDFYKNGLAISYEKLGALYQAQGKFDTALVFFLKRSQLGEELYRDNPKSESLKNGLAISYEKLGALYQAQGKFDTALVFFLKDLKLTEELYRDNPQNVELWFGLGVSYYKLGAVHEALKQPAQAIPYYERSAAIFREMYAAIGLEKYRQNYLFIEKQIERLK